MRFDFKTLFLGVASGVLFVVGMPMFYRTIDRVSVCAQAADRKSGTTPYHCNIERVFVGKKFF